MSRHSRWPVRVKRGNFQVTICTGDRKKNGRIYREFKLLIFVRIGRFLCVPIRAIRGHTCKRIAGRRCADGDLARADLRQRESRRRSHSVNNRPGQLTDYENSNIIIAGHVPLRRLWLSTDVRRTCIHEQPKGISPDTRYDCRGYR